jgi:hypothetical protein
MMHSKTKRGKTAAESMEQTLGWVGVIDRSGTGQKPPVKLTKAPKARNYEMMDDLRKSIRRFLVSKAYLGRFHFPDDDAYALARIVARVVRKHK